MLQNLWQLLVGLAICLIGLIILYLDIASSARQAVGLAKPDPSKENPPPT